MVMSNIFDSLDEAKINAVDKSKIDVTKQKQVQQTQNTKNEQASVVEAAMAQASSESVAETPKKKPAPKTDRREARPSVAREQNVRKPMGTSNTSGVNMSDVEDKFYKDAKEPPKPGGKRRKTTQFTANPNPASLRNIPRALLDKASYHLGGTSLNQSEIASVIMALYLDIPDSELKEIFSCFADGGAAAYATVRHIRGDVTSLAGQREWAVKTTKAVSKLDETMTAALLVNLATLIDFQGGPDRPGAGQNIDFDSDAVRYALAQVLEDVKDVRKQLKLKEGRI